MDIKLSQCMIVKNEEANIEQALGWGKNICFEQIVVDTGSTDNTVEIAQRLGAKVFHFPWIEDFAAAKNYAIEQASGDWIAFLDADEYFKEEDIVKIKPAIKRCLAYPKGKRPCAIGSGLLHLNNEGQVFSTGKQTRLFNRREVCYQGKIHENIVRKDGSTILFLDAYEELIIYHTGYSQKSYKSVNKLERNITMIQKVLEENPDNYNYWAYLGDSLLADKQLNAAEQAYEKIINQGEADILPSRLDMTYANLMRIYSDSKCDDMLSRVEALYAKYKKTGGICPDVDFWAGVCMDYLSEKEKAVDYLESGLKHLEVYDDELPIQMSGQLNNVYIMLTRLYYSLQCKQECVRCAVLALRMDAYTEGVLSVMLALLMEEKGEADNPAGTYNFLAKLYHMDSLKDLLFIFKCARTAGFNKLADLMYNAFPEDVQKRLGADKGEDA